MPERTDQLAVDPRAMRLRTVLENENVVASGKLHEAGIGHDAGRADAIGERVGDASSIKMMRSVVIKGLEALTTECLVAARRAGVEEVVIASLHATDPGIDWRWPVPAV